MHEKTNTQIQPYRTIIIRAEHEYAEYIRGYKLSQHAQTSVMGASALGAFYFGVARYGADMWGEQYCP
jgi:hypothetical protein